MAKAGRREHCRAGFAVALVMVAVATALVLSCVYLSEQSAAVQISHNLDAREQARMVAESGLEMAIAYVRASDNWREECAEGLWVKDQPFAGGSFCVYGQDGHDLDGDGTVDGDGDLADDWMDTLTLTAVGRCQDAEYTVRAVVPPFKRALMIVTDPANLSGEDTERCALLCASGWKVRLLRAKATADELDEALPNIHVVYFPAHVNLESNVKDKLKVLDLPIVTGHKRLVKELGIASSDSADYSGTAIDILQLTRTTTDEWGNPQTEVVTHYITSPFALGRLDICHAPDNLLALSGGTIGTRALAARLGEPDRPALAILETGALRTDKRPARARRVALPWGKEGLAFSFASLNGNGRTIFTRAMDWSGSSWRGYLPGIAVWERIEVKDMATVDGFESAAGAYGGDNVNGLCTLSTNSIGADHLKISGGVVNGYLYVSPDADIATVVEIGAGGALTGDCRYLSLNVPVLAPEQPKGMPGSSGDRTYTTGLHTIWSDAHFGKLTIKGDAKVHIMSDVRILCDGDVRIEEGGQLIVNSLGKLTLYTNNGVEIRHNARVNVESADPTKLCWFILKDKILVLGDAKLYAIVRTYDGTMEIKDAGGFYGTFVGRNLRIEHSGAFHIDTSHSGTIVTLGGGYDLEKIALGGVRWLEGP